MGGVGGYLFQSLLPGLSFWGWMAWIGVLEMVSLKEFNSGPGQDFDS